VELNILLRNVVDQISENQEWIRLNFVSTNEDVAQVDLSPADLQRLVAYLSQVAEKYSLATQMMFNDPEPAPAANLPPTETQPDA
jgi:hypothetical protein